MLDAITIDGPAATGKNTVGEAVAAALGWHLLDTGAMYRAVAVAVLNRNAPAADWPQIAHQVDVRMDGLHQFTYVDGRDVTDLLRSPEVESMVSIVAAEPAVREALVTIQRELAARTRLVLVGRDTGTKVLANARFKFYLDASAEVRAARRLAQHPAGRTLDEVQREIEERDRRDTEREASPLRIAEDALVIDTGPLTVEQVAQQIVARVQAG